MPQLVFENLPFEEALEYFRRKLNLPTAAWDDLWQGMHTRAFTVAGATKADLLAELRGEIDKAIAEGSTLETFRKAFDEIVVRHQWIYKGGRAWRTQTMLETNIRVAYSAGRWQQQNDPAVLAYRPYRIYRHGDSRMPRPHHLAWDGLILPADDPWWQTHYPPNGWG